MQACTILLTRNARHARQTWDEIVDMMCSLKIMPQVVRAYSHLRCAADLG